MVRSLAAASKRHGRSYQPQTGLPRRQWVDVRPRFAIDAHAVRFKRRNRRVHHFQHVAVDTAVRIVKPRSHPHRPHVAWRWRQLRHPRRLTTQEYVEQQLQIVAAARQRTEHVDVGLGGAAAYVIQVAGGRDQPEARLVTPNAVVRGREADRASDVGADFKTGEAHRRRGGGTARRTAGNLRQIPGIAGGAEQVVEGLVVGRPARQVRLADHDRTGCAGCCHDGGICIGNIVSQLAALRRLSGSLRSSMRPSP